MTIYISMLRGINVSGQKKVRMEELKKLYESLGFERVRTYIQSGNVVFEHPGADVSDLTGRIERAIEGRFGIEVPVILRTRDELRTVIGNLPFTGKDDAKVHVTFLSANPAR